MSRLSIEIPDDMHRQLKAQASLRGLSMREYVLRRLRPESGAVQPGSGDPVSAWDWLDQPSFGTRTKAEIDAYIAEERASWNDDE